MIIFKFFINFFSFVCIQFEFFKKMLDFCLLGKQCGFSKLIALFLDFILLCSAQSWQYPNALVILKSQVNIVQTSVSNRPNTLKQIHSGLEI